MSARSTSSRSTSSFSTSVRSRSNGPWKTSRSRSMVAARIWSVRLRGGSEAHRLADVRQGAGRDRPGAVGAFGEGPLEGGLVGADLVVALAHGRQVVDHGLRDRGLEVPVALALELALDRVRIRGAHHAEDVDQVA